MVVIWLSLVRACMSEPNTVYEQLDYHILVNTVLM